jgi:hypothetical protein
MKSTVALKGLLVGLLAVCTAGCAHLKTRVPPSALKADKVIYLSDIQAIPKSILDKPTALPAALQAAKLELTPETWAALLDALLKLGIDTSGDYFTFRKEVAYINRELLIKGYDTNCASAIVGQIMSLPTKSIINNSK